jgi:2'-5' RNA ligase
MANESAESVLLVSVPPAGPAVARYRSRLDSSAPLGVPAHVTVLYPFLPPPEVSADVLASLSRLFASVGRFRFLLDRTGWFDDRVLWLGPRDPAPFRALTQLVFSAFPSCPPYGGQFPDVVPHLTVGDVGPLADLHAAEEAVRPYLPIPWEATEVTLMIGLPTGGLWTTVAAFPLG